jgi:hypothetical protein
VLGVVVLIWIGIQPPNQKALPVTAVTIILLVTLWWAGLRRIFPGPPVMSITADNVRANQRERSATIQA